MHAHWVASGNGIQCTRTESLGGTEQHGRRIYAISEMRRSSRADLSHLIMCWALEATPLALLSHSVLVILHRARLSPDSF